MNIEVSRSRAVLIMPANDRDAETCARILREAKLDYKVCRDVSDLTREIQAGAGVVVIAEDSLKGRGTAKALKHALRRQPRWSELPLVLLSKGGAASHFSQTLAKELGSMLVLERPTTISSLLNAIEASLKARERQYDIREYLREREQAAAALKEADRKKDDFLAILAHELRNPMAAISTASSLLSRENIPPEQAKMATNALKRRVAQLARLVDDLLDVSRIIRGKITLNKEITDLSVIAVTAAEATQNFFNERQQSIETKLTEPLLVSGDPVRLEQIVTNLLTNASRYTAERGNVEMSVLREGSEAVIRVTDNGIGIAKENLSKIFELFEQAEDSLHRTKGGLGIGLTVVQRLTHMHGGSVFVRSAGLGTGSTFTVRFPLADLQLPREERREQTARVEPGLKVLIIEDNEDTAVMCSRLLEHEGHEVKVALDGPSGLRAALEQKPDVVLLDIGLPEMDGFQVASEIRKHGLGETLIVAVTGYGQQQDLHRAKEAGIDHHLLKPLTPLALNRLLADYQKSARFEGWRRENLKESPRLI